MTAPGTANRTALEPGAAEDSDALAAKGLIPKQGEAE